MDDKILYHETGKRPEPSNFKEHKSANALVLGINKIIQTYLASTTEGNHFNQLLGKKLALLLVLVSPAIIV